MMYLEEKYKAISASFSEKEVNRENVMKMQDKFISCLEEDKRIGNINTYSLSIFYFCGDNNFTINLKID